MLGFVLPSKVVFGNYYPTVLEHRRKELNKYLRIIGACLSSDNTYLREFFEVDENILKYALKKNRRLSDVYRSDNIRQIYKRASEQMIDGRASRRLSHQRRKDYQKTASSTSAAASSSSSSSSSLGRTSSISSSPPGFNIIKHHHKQAKTLPSSSRHKEKGTNTSNTISNLQEHSRQFDSFSSHNDTILDDSLQESSITSALKDDFLTLSRIISSDTYIDDDNHKDTVNVSQQQQQPQQTYISNVNSCFRQLSEDGSWTDNSSHSKVLDILTPSSLPPLSHMTQMLTDMTNITQLIQQHLAIPFTTEELIIDPSSKWTSDFHRCAASQAPIVPRPPYNRPHSQESTIPLRLRFNKDDTGANMPPHLMKHLL